MESFRVLFKDIKFEHSLFALPFTYLGLFLGEKGWPSWYLFLWVTTAMVSFRTFAMAMNRLVDREIDARNPRTQWRALPQARLTSRFVYLAAFSSLLIFIISAWALGPLCFFLSPVPIFLAWLYPYLKRFTWLSHIVLGIILGISPYGAWLASRGEFSWIPGFLFLGVASWVSGFDILYALQDYEFDCESRLESIPVRFGKRQALGVSGALHLIALLSWWGAGALAGLGWIYEAGLLLVTFFLFREHFLIHRYGLEKIEQAFFTLNAGISSAVFVAAWIDLNWR